MKTLRITTRKSPLAIWQAEHIKQSLQALSPDLDIQLVGLTTTGDKILDQDLTKVGGKGLFVKELEVALLDGRADIAVHSMKDVPAEFLEGLSLAVICERADPWDCLVSNKVSRFDELPLGAKVGTSSLRRQSQIKALRPDLELIPLRGNVNTRLKKLDNNDYDAIILAQAGLNRLGLCERIRQVFSKEQLLPAPGQGALGIECRTDDNEILDLLNHLEHQVTRQCVSAERAMSRVLGGNCQVPVAAYAEINNSDLILYGKVGMPDGSRIIADSIHGAVTEAEQLGEQLAQRLIANGANEILQQLDH